MLTVLAVALVVFIGLIALMWLGTIWAQGYFYDSVVDNLSWRAPAAAGALAFFFLLWMALENRRPNTADTLFRFSSEHADEFDRFISVRRDQEGDKEIVYERHRLPSGRVEFVDSTSTPWARSKSGMMIAIILEEKVDGEDKPRRYRFNAELSPDGKTFAPSIAGGAQQPVRYIEEGGSRFIVENQIGKALSYRRGRMVMNIIVNLLQFALWFVALWLLLRFQWPHALLGAVGCWLVMSLGPLPFMLDRARDASKSPPKTIAALFPPQPLFAESLGESWGKASLAKARGETESRRIA
jgi:hypothetical protein